MQTPKEFVVGDMYYKVSEGMFGCQGCFLHRGKCPRNLKGNLVCKNLICGIITEWGEALNYGHAEGHYEIKGE